MTTTTLPYCTVKGFRRCLEILRRAGLPQHATDATGASGTEKIRVDRTWLLEQGFSPHAVYPVIGALRFLRIVDDAGRPTEVLACFLDPSDLEGRRAAVEAVYGEVLSSIEMPVDDRERVDKLLIERHGCAPGVAAFCSTFMLWLAADAGMPIARPGRRRRGRPPAHLSQLSPAARAVLVARAPDTADAGADDPSFGEPEAPPSAPSAPGAPDAPDAPDAPGAPDAPEARGGATASGRSVNAS